MIGFLRKVLLCAGLLSFSGVMAQSVREELALTPPRFEGADAQHFMRRLVGEFEKVAAEREIPAAELSSRVGVAFVVDTLGRAGQWRFCDNTSPGEDRCDLGPATEATRAAFEEAFLHLGTWQPAEDALGRRTDYTVRLTVRLPVEKLARSQQVEPLLFQGEDPAKRFPEWVRSRVRYEERFAGVTGTVRVHFYVEPDGRITDEKVVETPDERLSWQVIRAVRTSRGQWTPRKIRGVPQRTAWEFCCDYPEAADR